MDSRCQLMKAMLMASVAASLLLVAMVSAAAVTDQASVETTGEQQQQHLDLGPITNVRAEVAKLDLPKPLECQLFASRILQVVGRQQADSQQDALARLARSIDSQSATDKAATGGDQVDSSHQNSELVEYVNECVRSIEAEEDSEDVSFRVEATHELLDMAKQRMAKLEVELRQHQVAKEMTAKEATNLEAQIAKWKGHANEFSEQLQQEQEKVAKLESEVKQLQVDNKTKADRVSDLLVKIGNWRTHTDQLKEQLKQQQVKRQRQEEQDRLNPRPGCTYYRTGYYCKYSHEEEEED